jgi:hypothetical protein
VRIPAYDVNLFRFDAMQRGVSSNRNAALVMELCVADGVRNFSTVSLKFAPRTAGEGPICMPPPLCSRQAEEEDGTGRHRSQRSKHGRGDQADRRLGRERPIRKLTHRQDWQLAGVARHDHSWN